MRRIDGGGRSSTDLSDARVDESEKGRPATKFLFRDRDFKCDGIGGELLDVPARTRKVER